MLYRALTSLLVLVTLAACGPDVPEALLVDGKPVDPICFIPVGDEETDQIPAKNCPAEGLIIRDHTRRPDNAFVVTYEYAGTEGGMSAPYMQYKVLGGQGNNAIVLIGWSGGGTGHFTALALLERADDMLNIKSLVAGGDRCNGGISDAKVNEDGALTYSANITPYDMLVLGGDPERTFLQSVRAYDDLDACAACCYGTAQFTGEELTGITLSDDLSTRLGGKNSENEKQACFDRLITAQTQTRFSPDEWESVMREVEHVCLGRVEGE